MLADQFRHCIATQSETGLLVAADALQESDNSTDQRLGELLRCYVDIQTYVRVSQPIPHDLGIRYEELNKFFNAAPTKGFYSKPLGIYYTACNVSMDYLLEHPEILESEPIRELTIRGCVVGSNLEMLLRNHRIDWMHEVTLRMRSAERNPLNLGDAIRQMMGTQLQRLNIYGITDRGKRVQTMFQLNRNIRKGARLTISESCYSDWNLTSCVKRI